MSWSIYATAKSVADLRAYVAATKEPTPEANYGTPPEAKGLILTALDMAGIPAACGVKLEASGHAGGGTFRLVVEPITFCPPAE